ncbi:MAG: ATP phosphoribosyltransferase regulatory subunit [Thermoleophilia bacterium]
MSILRTPAGTKDVLPLEAAELRLIEEAVRTVFEEFGYGEVRTPSLEYEEVMALSEEAALLTGFRLLDEHGELLLLRPDLTPPIARLVASRLQGGVPPHRVYSVSKVFRRIPLERGQEAEFRQAGIELLGLDDPAADAEVIGVACRALDRAGLRDFRVGVGQVGFFVELLASLLSDGAERHALVHELVEKDFVGFRLRVEAAGLSAADREAVLAVPDLRGGADVLDKAAGFVRNQGMASALERLGAVRESVGALGYGDKLLFDFGLFRNLEYYTGLVFEVYAPGVGATLGGGGRYDNLLARFGRPMPAVGFGLGMDRVHEALLKQGADLARGEPLALMVGGLDRFAPLADRLRGSCVNVFALPSGFAADELVLLARQKEADLLVEPADSDGRRWAVSDLRGEVTETCSADALVDQVCHAAFEHGGFSGTGAPRGAESPAGPGLGPKGDEGAGP